MLVNEVTCPTRKSRFFPRNYTRGTSNFWDVMFFMFNFEDLDFRVDILNQNMLARNMAVFTLSVISLCRWIRAGMSAGELLEKFDKENVQT
jgi:hypothetical protein